MTDFLLIDVANTFFRSKHVVSNSVDTDTKIGMAIHITLSSIAKTWTQFNAKHVVFCLEGHSWRKAFYEPYKKNRIVDEMSLTASEQEETELFWEAFREMVKFVTEKSNCTTLQHDKLEADDLIAGFIQNHPDHNHTIISSDSDFYQLLADNVQQYNGVSEQLITINGVFDKNGKRVIDKKTKEEKVVPNPDWLLFEKCMRGDKSDNIFSAYPGVRTKGSRNKVGLQEAFADHGHKGYAWNNLMLQRWVDHNGNEHKVRDDYERNRILVDLSLQPDDVRTLVDEATTNIAPKNISGVGTHFLRFCGKHELVRLSNDAMRYSTILGSKYQK